MERYTTWLSANRPYLPLNAHLWKAKIVVLKQMPFHNITLGTYNASGALEVRFYKPYSRIICQ